MWLVAAAVRSRSYAAGPRRRPLAGYISHCALRCSGARLDAETGTRSVAAAARATRQSLGGCIAHAAFEARVEVVRPGRSNECTPNHSDNSVSRRSDAACVRVFDSQGRWIGPSLQVRRWVAARRAARTARWHAMVVPPQAKPKSAARKTLNAAIAGSCYAAV